jgi:tetratricopeptide (TPR) repeat protein
MCRCRLSVVAVLLLAGGCTLLQPAPEPLTGAPVELDGTPFFPQRDFMCGPAALATVLGASGVDIHPDELIEQLYIPERRGTLQVELMAAARRQGRVAVPLPGKLPALVDQLEAGRPVLVLQNLALNLWPKWHYAVVVGYLPEQRQFVLRSGGERREITRHVRFDATWRRADRWALVLLDPAEEPGNLPPRAYLGAAADLENVGAHHLALAAFRTAAAAWPEEPNAWLGAANNLYYLQRHEDAAAAYRRVLADHPEHVVALHNLTLLLLEMDRPCEARHVANAVRTEGPLLDTARRAAAAADGACAAADDGPPTMRTDP